MSRNRHRRARVFFRHAFRGVCALVVAYVVFAICATLLLAPFGGFHVEFSDLSGSVAKERMMRWPVGIDSRDVHAVSHKYCREFDCSSAWYRVRLTSEAAAMWADFSHTQQAVAATRSDDSFEGVRRTVPGPPPQRCQTGTTPSWWKPLHNEFRATEVMTWYADYDSGVGRAAYSAFDESTGMLWVYEYFAQHDILWPRGNVPEGDRFQSSDNAS